MVYNMLLIRLFKLLQTLKLDLKASDSATMVAEYAYASECEDYSFSWKWPLL